MYPEKTSHSRYFRALFGVAGLLIFADAVSAQEKNHQKSLPQFEVLSARDLGLIPQASPRPETTSYSLDSAVIPSSNLHQLKLGKSLDHKPWDCDVFVNPRSNACLGLSAGKEPSNLFEKIVQKGAGYATQYAPSLFGEKAVDLGGIVKSEVTNFLISSGVNYANKEIQKIPFFAQTVISINAGSMSDLTFSADSLMKLSELGRDRQGDLKGLAFAQGKVIGTTSSGTTWNAGLGSRYRMGDEGMVGANVFWDYRITPYNVSYSRWGIGAEGFWKTFELRNNWYISGTDTQEVNINGTAYYERVVPGWDVELGYRIPSYPQLGMFVRGFVWDYQQIQDNSGLEGTLSWQATPHTNFELWVSNEIPAYPTVANSSLGNNTDTYFGGRIRLTGRPVLFAKNSTKQNLIAQMTQPVRRRYEVLLERWLKPVAGFVNRVSGS